MKTVRPLGPLPRALWRMLLPWAFVGWSATVFGQLPTVTLSSTDPLTAEPAGNAHFTVSRDGSTLEPLVVSYTVAGTATEGLDYEALGGTMTIPAGKSSVNLAVQVVDDTLIEGGETVELQLEPQPGYLVGEPPATTITILDNEVKPAVAVRASDAEAAEAGGNPGEFTFTRTGSLDAALVVHYAIGGTAAPGADYAALGDTLTIPAGSAAGTLTVVPLDDVAFEGTETVSVSVLAAVDYTVSAAGASAEVRLRDDELPTVTLSSTDPLTAEPAGNAHFTVSRDGSTLEPLVVSYTVAGTATEGLDYEALGGTMTIPAGKSSVNLAVQVVDDTLIEGNESMVVTLAADAGYLMGDTLSATITILDNEIRPMFTVVSPAAYQVFQRDATGEANIRLQGSYHGPPLPVEAAWGDGVWQVVDPAPSDTFTGSLTRQPAGQAPLRVRVQGQPDSEVVVPYVGVGDIFAVWGQSNGGGRGVNNQSYSHPTLKAALFGNDWRWGELTDPTDRNTGQVDLVSSDVDNGMGSVWPLVATRLMAELNVPVAFVPCTKGATGFPAWSADATDPLVRTTLFGSAVSRCLAVGGVKAVLWWNGEGGFDDVTGNSYVTPFKAMSAQMAVHLPGVNIVACKVQYCVGISDIRQQNGWHACQRIWDEDPHATSGPTLADDPPPENGNLLTEDEGRPPPWYHLKSDAALEAAADRWAVVLLDIARPPSLRIAASADHLILSWPRRNTYMLEKSTSPNSVWTAVEANPVVVGEEMSLSLPISHAEALFRLRRR